MAVASLWRDLSHLTVPINKQETPIGFENKQTRPYKEGYTRTAKIRLIK